MIIPIIKNYILSVCYFFVLYKLVFPKRYNKSSSLYLHIASGVLCILTTFLKQSYPALSYFGTFLVLFLLVMFVCSIPIYRSYYLAIISYTFCLLLYECISLLLILVISPFHQSISKYHFNALALVSCVMCFFYN